MKAKYNYKCQICGFTFKKKNGGYYTEVAHIEPIKSATSGIDTPSNLIVLCPNHHKMLDFGDVEILTKNKLKINGKILRFLSPLF